MKRSYSIFAILGIFTLLTPVSVVHAQTATEQGDAGQTLGTAQDLTGFGPLTFISGTIGSPNDADIFKIRLDGTPFTATTVGHANFDTVLALFDASGTLLRQNDDSAGTAQSTISGNFAAGNYLLGISSFANFPTSGPTYGNTYPGFFQGSYGIALTGTAAVPELSTMLGFGSFVFLGGLAAFRQRKQGRKTA